MVFKGLIAATASIALMATPAMAASSASAAAAKSATTAMAPADETVDGLQMEGGGNIVVILLALIAVGLGIWALLDNDDAPASP